VRHLRNTVRFADGVQRLLQDKSRLYVETGPGNILGTFVRQSHDAIVQRIFASLRHRDEPVGDDVHLRTVAGRLWASGLDIEAARLWPGNWPHLPLPGYAFQHSRYWVEASASDPQQNGDEALFPQRAPFGPEWFWEPRWVQKGIAQGAAPPPQAAGAWRRNESERPPARWW
jgi:acyl transferase domain-containing protein